MGIDALHNWLTQLSAVRTDTPYVTVSIMRDANLKRLIGSRAIREDMRHEHANVRKELRWTSNEIRTHNGCEVVLQRVILLDGVVGEHYVREFAVCPPFRAV